jgi:hypothetical protein
LEEADSLRQKQVERVQYEAGLAPLLYARPDNRLVADSLEAEWNSKLRTLTDTQQNRERQREQDRKVECGEYYLRSVATSFAPSSQPWQILKEIDYH